MKRFLLGFGTLFLLPTLALAATMQHGDSVVLQSALQDDFYAAGNSITIGQPIDGDAIVAGNAVTITAPVTGDINAAGSTLQISAEVGDDARVAGSTVTLTNSVGGDVIAAGSDVTFAGSFAAQGGVWAFGNNVTFNGTAASLEAYGNSVTIFGAVEGPLEVRADRVTINAAITGPALIVAREITIAESASFAEGLRYWREAGPMTTEVDAGGDGAVFDPTLQPHTDQAPAMGAFAGAFNLFWILSTAIILGVFVGLARKYFAQASVRLEKNFGWNLLYGLVYLVLTPVICLLLFVTIFGIPLAMLLLVLYACSLFFLPAAMSLMVALWIERYAKQSWNAWLLLLVAVGVYIVLRLIGAVPLVGWMVNAVLFLAVAGALTMTKKEYLQKLR